MTLWRLMRGLVGALLVLAASGVQDKAAAHPHVWVTAKAEVVFEGGKIAGIQHHWTFDEFYTAMAIVGLDKNGDGIYSREELAELAKVNMQGLSEFDFFTFAMLGKAKVEFSAPVDAWLEHKDGVLTLHFRLPLKAPIEAATPGFSFAVYDPSYFIAFELAKGEAVGMTGAPAGCKVVVGAAAEPAETADNQTLAGAFAEQMPGGVFSGGTTKSAAVTCAK